MGKFFLLIVPIAVQIVVLYGASVYLNRGTYARFGRGAYLLLMWPGVVVHELSHLVACLVTFTRPRKVRLFAPSQETPDTLVLGYVQHDKPRGAFSAALIGAAPFFGGSAVLYLLFRLFLGSSLATSGLAIVLPSTDTSTLASTLAATATSYAGFVRALVASLRWDAWTTYLFLYLVVVISSHVAPSRPDLKHTLLGLVGFAIAAGTGVLVTRWIGYALTDADVAWLSRPVLAVSALLGCGIAGAGLFSAVLFAVETSVALFRRVRHRQ